MPGQGLTQDDLGIRDRIKSAMLRCCAEKGYRGVALETVCDRFGGTAADFYDEFQDLESCFAAAYQVEGERVYERWRELTAGAGSRREQLEAGLEELAETVERHPRLARSMLVEVHSAGREAIAKRHEILDRLAETLDSGPMARSPIGPTTQAAFALGAIEGTFSRLLINEEPERLSAIVPELVEVLSSALEP